jgi:hypothetical protein
MSLVGAEGAQHGSSTTLGEKQQEGMRLVGAREELERRSMPTVPAVADYL